VIADYDDDSIRSFSTLDFGSNVIGSARSVRFDQPSSIVYQFQFKCDLMERNHILGPGPEVFILYQLTHGRNFQLPNGDIVLILGHGMIKFLLQGHEVMENNTFHIPAYGNMIQMSLAIHGAQHPGCGVFHCQVLVFPSFQITFAEVGVYSTEATSCSDLHDDDCISVASLHIEIDDSD